MWFIGLVIGIVVGGTLFGFTGALLVGMLGWVVGMMIGSNKPSTTKAASYTKPEPGQSSLETMRTQRIQFLEQQLATVKERLTLIEKNLGIEPIAPAVVVPEPEPAAKAETSPQSIPLRPAAAAMQPVTEQKTVAMPAENSAAEQTISTPTIPSPRPSPAFDAHIKKPKDPGGSLGDAIIGWFTGGNTIVKIGALILFFGVGFLLKYAIDSGFIGIELRAIAIAIAAMVIIGIGWRLRNKRPEYAMVMQGLGVGLLYLTLFGAYRLYHLLPGSLTFALMVGVAVFSAILAIAQNSMPLAIVGVTGGFLAPILASTGGGSHVGLFSYYAILNLGIFIVAWYKAWKPLNVLGFLFTFGIGTMWGSKFYQPEFFSTTEPFLILFFIFYVAIAVLFALRRSKGLDDKAAETIGYVDGTLVFGTPLIGFGLQAWLMRDSEYGLAFSALALALMYIVLAYALWGKRAQGLRLLTESFLALGVIFGTLAIPLALDAKWTSGSWALEGAAILWVGLRQKRQLATAFGFMLQFAAGAALLKSLNWSAPSMPILNSTLIGCLLVSLAGFFVSWQLNKHNTPDKKSGKTPGFLDMGSVFMLLWGLIWWLVGGYHEVDRHVASNFQLHGFILFITATAVLLSLAASKLNWPIARAPTYLLLPVLFLFALGGSVFNSHPFAKNGFIAWPIALLAFYWLLRRHDQAKTPALSLQHAGGLWLLMLIGSVELHWLMGNAGLGESAWSVAAPILLPCLAVWLIARDEAKQFWPLSAKHQSYISLVAMPLLALFFVWVFYANASHDGSSQPLPYLPFLNALDLGHILIGLTLWRGYQSFGLGKTVDTKNLTLIATGIAAFVWVNSILLRTIHHWAGVPYNLSSLLSSNLVQTSLSIFWTILALALMFIATRKNLRVLWVVGAGLMGVVIAKLFLVDLSNVGTVERIVSFIVVGILMLVIGYFSPMPPKQKLAENP
jgi:uncharacterized membrane protein